jgi:hypothetical protein
MEQWQEAEVNNDPSASFKEFDIYDRSEYPMDIEGSECKDTDKQC